MSNIKEPNILWVLLLHIKRRYDRLLRKKNKVQLEENWNKILENRKNTNIKKATQEQIDYIYNKLKNLKG